MPRENPEERRLKLEPEKLKLEREELLESEGRIKTGLQKLKGRGRKAISIALVLSIVGTGLAHEPVLHDEMRLINTQKVEQVSKQPSTAFQEKARILWTVKGWAEKNATEKPTQNTQSHEEFPHTHNAPMNKILIAIKPKKPKI